MTRPHPTAAELLAHARRTLSPAETLEVSEHLAACAACRTALASLMPAPAGTRDTVQPGPAPGVDYETLTSYLDDTLDPVDREILEADLRNHPALAAQLADLRRWQVEQETAPASRPPTVIPFPVPTWRASLLRPVAAAAALLALAGLVWRYSSAPPSALTLRDDGREGSLQTLTDAPDIPSDLQAAARTAALTGEILLPGDWKTLRGEPGTLLAETSDPNPGNPAFSLLAPVGVAVRGLQPVFRWTPRAGASAYRVTVLETPDGETQSSPLLPAQENTWTPTRPLAAGKRYAWQVQALDSGGGVLEKAPSPPWPEACFQTLDAAEEAGLRRVELAHPQAHLLLAVAQAKLGLLPEAEQHLRKLAAANPGNSLPGALLGKVRRFQGHAQPSATAAPTATNGAQ